ncbi:MAG: metallophosphoesterase family protein [Bacteroidales bacterium]
MKILHLSDTHSKHRLLQNLPTADVIIHSGDASLSGSEEEVLDFLNCFCDLDYPHKIFVAGNHDDCLYGEQIEGLPDNFHYLCHSGVEIEGVHFWGVPLFLEDGLKDGQIEKLTNRIPDNTDVLISHSPPYGILDFEDNVHYGCEYLLERTKQIKPRLHLFGHVHANHGITKIHQTTFANSTIMNEEYKFINKPRLLEL